MRRITRISLTAIAFCLPLLSQSTSTVIASAQNPAASGSTVFYTATVVPSPGIGTVNFTDNGTSIGTAAVNGSGVATVNKNYPTSGSHSIIANYSGGGSFTPSSSSTLTELIKDNTTTSLGASLSSPSTFGSAITLTATVSPTVSGSVTFYNGSTVLGTSTLSSGQATLSTRLLPTGTNKLRAFYKGTSTAFASTSSTLTQTVTSKNQGFQSAISYAAGSGASGVASVVTGDFNGDGIPDIAAANFSSTPGTIAVLLGTGPGTFGSATTYTVLNGSPRAIAVGDFNGDGKADLVVTNYNSRTFTIMLGDGTGAFSSQTTNDTGFNGAGQPTSLGTSIVVADFDGDGNADVAVANNGSSNVSVFPGAGNGTFGFATVYSAGSGAFSLVAGDFNSDGLADLAVANPSANTITVLLSTGGGFAAPATYTLTAGAAPNAIATGDFNGDGILDLVTANFGNNTISLLLGAANGTFGSATSTSTGAGSGPFQLAVGDFNGDGKADVITANETASNLGVLLGNGSGSFAAPAIYGIGAGNSNPYWLAVVDFNGDGTSDVVSADFTSSNLSVLLGTPSYFNGQQVKLEWDYPTLGTVFQNNLAATAGPGVEFTNYTAGNPAFNVDYGDTTISVASAQTLPPANNFAIAAFNGLILGNPGTGTIPPFTSVSIASANWPDGSGNPFTRSRVTFDSTHIYVDFGGMVNQVGDSVVLQINPALSATTTTLSINPNPSIVGQTVTLTANTSAGASGTVSFFKNSVAAANFLGSGTLASGTASLLTSALPAGTTAIIAFYNGDSTHDVSTSNSVSQVVKNTTTTSLSSNQNPAGLGDTVTFTATVTPSSATGTVTFTADGVTFGSATLNGSGVATKPIASLTVGSHAIVATYLGDSAAFTSTSATLTQLVKTATTTTLATSPNPSVVNGNVIFTTTVTPNTGSTVPTGTVTLFNAGSFLSGPATLDGSGVAAITAANLPKGSNSITSVYSGDTNNAGSTSSIVTQTVQVATTLKISSSKNPSGIGQNVTFTAHVSGQGLFQSSSTITFYDNGTYLAGPFNPDVETGYFSFQTSSLATGPHIIAATYSGDPQYQASSDSLNQTVLPATTTSLSVQSGTVYFGQPITLTATVNQSSATGWATFFDGATMLGSAPVNSGTATLSTPLLPSGVRSLRVLYGGDSSWSASNSPIVSKTISTRQQSGFAASVQYATGTLGDFNSTVTSLVGDFNGDGKQDLAVLDYDSDAGGGVVSILTGNGDGTFQPAQTYKAGVFDYDLAMGDFNGDGKPDLMVADDQNGVVLLTNNGDGTFTVGDFPVYLGDTVDSLAVGDVNGDGIADVVFGNAGAAELALGNGDGTFTWTSVIASTQNYMLVKLADMNSDGIADVIWTEGFTVNVQLGNGDGTFQAQGLNQYSAPGVITFAVADVTGDQKPDIAIGTNGTVVSIFPGNGDGTLGTVQDISVGNYPEYVAVGDFNGDGNPDILAADPNTGDISIIPGLGNGNFGTVISLSSGLSPSGLTVGNFESGTGRSDFVVPNGHADDVFAFLALPPAVSMACPVTAPAVVGVAYSLTCSGSGGVSPYTYSLAAGTLPPGLGINASTGVISGTPTTTGSYTFAIRVDDSNTPAQNAIVTPSITVATQLTFVSTPLPAGLLNIPYSTPVVSGGTTPYTCGKTSGAFPVGLTLDPTTCVLSGTPTATGTSLFTILAVDNGTPAQSNPKAFSLTIQGGATTTTLQSSVNPSSSGQQTVLSATVTPGTATGTVVFYDGAVQLGSPVTLSGSGGIAFNASAFSTVGTHSLTASYSGDSSNSASTSSPLSQVVLPASTTTLSASPTSPFFGQPVTLTATVGGGTATGDKVTFFDGTIPLGTGTVTAGGTATLSTTFIGPGLRSLYARYPGSGTLGGSLSPARSTTVQVRVQNGFGAVVPYTTGSNMRAVALGDVDKDGIQDIIAADSSGTGVVILTGIGDGTFHPAVPVSAGASVTAIAVGDLNGDGNPDLALATGSSGVTILLGNGNGTFGSPTNYSTPGATGSIALGDFDNDGKLDIAAGYSSGITTLRGLGNGTFASAVTAHSTSGTAIVAVADFNSDGKLDLASADTAGTIRTQFGNGDGTFQPSTTYPSSITPISLSIADFNHDTHPDLLIGDNGVGVKVMLGSGSGILSAQVNYAAGTVPGYVTTGDVNGDGKIDIVAADFSSPKVFTLAGNGDGTFQSAVSYTTTNPPFALAVGNFRHGNGRADIVAGYAAGDIGVLLSQAASISVSCTPGSAPPVLTGVAYSINCTPTNGIAPFTYSISGGSLPTGLSINAATGAITGTPTVAGIFPYTVKIVDSDSPAQAATQSLSTTVVTPLTTTASPLTGGVVGTAYSATLFTGGTAPYSCGLSAGSYPPGLTVNGLTCVLSGTPATPGSYSFTVGNSDSGSPQQNLFGSFSLAITQPTTTSLSASANPATVGVSVTLTATVAPAGGTGIVTFKDGATTLGTGNVNGSGIATYSTSSLTVGLHSLTAIYAGDASFTTSTSSVLALAVKNATTTTLVSSLNPAPTGQSVTFTASVTPTSATGTVNFFDGAINIGTGSLNAGGIATFATSSLAPGPHTITATYLGDTNNFTSAGGPTTQTIRTATTTSLLASPAASALGTAVTLTATVSPTSAGQVTFYNGAAVLGTSTLSGATASLVTRLIPAGPNTLTAYYPGNATTAPSTSSVAVETITAAPQNGFGTGITYGAGAGPAGSAFADFNGDGRPDLIVANSGGTTLSLFPGTGAGTLGTAVSLTVGNHPAAVAVGDFNGDGKSDIAAVNTNDNSISILLGRGDGTFNPQVLYTAGVGPQPNAIVAADLNADGIVDLAIVNSQDHSISVLPGVGDGTFGAGTVYALSNPIAGIVAGDFNGDGILDLATTDQQFGLVSMLPGTGGGVFAGLISSPTGGTGSQNLTVYDFDGDGKLDVAVANATSNNVSVLFGNGTGAFGGGLLLPAGTSPYYVTTGDFNGDGKIDLAIANDGSSNVSILTGNGARGFAPHVDYGDGGSGAGARGLAVTDLNRDGISDIVISDFLSNHASVLLGLVPTTTTLTSSVNPSTFGSTTTLTATVSPASATGNVTFFDGATSVASASLTSGTAAKSLSFGTGTHSLTVVYSGDTADAVSTSTPVSQVVNPAPTVTTVTSSLNPSTFGASVTFTGSVVPAAATGVLTFKDGATTLGTANLLGGSGQFTTSALSVTSHAINVAYSGDGNDLSSTSSAFTQTVNPAPTTTSLTSSLNPSTFGATVTLTATVSPSSSTGPVTFKDGTTIISSATLNGSGQATFTVSTLSVATHSLTAVYGGDTNDASSTSSPLTQTVNQAVTTTTLTSSLNPSTFGAAVTLTATVSPTSSTGTVTFKDGATILGTATLNAIGVATYTTSALSVAAHSLTAIYSGDTNDATSTSSALTQTVNQAISTTTLTSSANPSVFGQTITLTATVSPANGSGTVTFKNGSTVIGTIGLASGTAVLNISTLQAGSNSLTAVYGGDTNDTGSTSSILTQAVNKTPTFSSVSGAPNPSLFGTSITFTANVSPASATGSVLFKDGTTALGSGSLTNGFATFQTSSLSAGVHSITAVYSGDSNDLPSTSSVFSQTVAALTALVLNAPGSSIIGQPVTLSASINPGSATGNVTFYAGATVLGIAPVSNGSATLTTALLPSGNNRLSAYYAGTPVNAPSSSLVVPVSVASFAGNGFRPSANYAAGSAPVSQAVADFNGDGITDLVVVNSGSGDVSVQLGNGDGTFQPAQNFASGANPISVATGDFNADGKVDLAVSNQADNTISILLGNGDGSFGAASPVPAGNVPGFVVVGDYNRDGISDLAVTDTGDNTFSILPGVGDGTFRPLVSYSTDSSPLAIAQGDFNDDGFTDLAIVNAGDNDVSVFTGNGDGTFGNRQSYSVGGGANFIASADFDGDGEPDLAVVNPNDNTVSILLNNEAGGFLPQVTYPTTAPGSSVAIGDFNGDGVLDLAITHTSGTLEVLPGNGNGTFGTAVSFPETTGGISALVADFNGDGRADIAVANNGSGDVSVLLAVVPTTTSLTSSQNPSVPGQNVTFTAAVSPSNATGTVTFKDGATSLGSGSLSGGTVQLNIANLVVGIHQISAVYAGDTANGASTSAILPQIVNQSGTTTTLTSSPNPSTFGQPVLLTAHVLPVTATGTIAFRDGSTVLGSSSLSAGTATLTVVNLSVASHSLTAAYGGDGNDIASTSSPLTQTVGLAPTTTNLTSSLNPSTFGAGVILTATVSPSSATGTVTFKDGSTILSTATVSGGIATLNISTLAVGSHPLTAAYGGDGNDAVSSSSVLPQTVNQAPSTTTLSASLNPSTFGASVTFTATVSPATASGTVTFKDGSTILGTGSLSSGVATLTISSLSVAAHSLTAAYGGDTNDVASISSPLAQTVNKAPTTTTLTSSLNPSTFGAAVTFTATVAPATATGTITFTDGATTLGTGSLSGGVATLTISSLSVATHSLTAAYGGDANDLANTSSSLPQTVNQAPTTTTLTSSLNPSTFGASVTLTATVTPSTATGTIAFNDGSTSVGTSTLSGGVATLTISSLSVASHSLAASYAGDTNDVSSVSGFVNQVVNKANSVLTLTSSANPANFGSPVTLTATLNSSTATGSITFKDGATTIGSATLSGGIAIFSSGLPFGSHSLTASYVGDAGNTAAQSAVLSQSVIYPPVTLTTFALPQGQAGIAYGPVSLQATGGSGSFSWSGSGFPTGIGVSSDGTVSGISPAAFNASVTITVTDNVSKQSITNSLNLTLLASTFVISGTSNLGTVVVGTPLSGQFSVSGGTTPYIWSLSAAPAGFSVDATGKVSGVASQAGNFAFTLQVKDSTPGTPQSATLGLSFSAFGLTTTSLPAASTLTDYNASVAAAGGTGPYSFSVSGLPVGLTFSGTSISGRAQTPGSSSVTVKAADSKGLSATATFALSVSGPGPLQILSSALADGAVNQPYSQTLSAAGGSPAYTWSQSGGVAPPGLTLTSSGTIFGQPTQPGSYSLGVQVNDTSGAQAVGTVSLNIAPATLQITGGSVLPAGIANSAYPSQILGATGGVAPYTFAQQGSLPDGLKLSNGQITGTPLVVGDFSFSVTVTDSAPAPVTATLPVSVTIRPQAADLVLSSGGLSFAITSGSTSVPSASAVTISSSVTEQALNFTVDASSAPWLTANGAGGTTPGTLSVGLSNAALALSPTGSPYSGTVIVTCTSGGCNGKSQSIGVTLTVTAPPPQLSLTSSIFSFIASTANPQASSAALGIQNLGGGKLTINSVTADASWITIGAFPPTVLPGPGAAVTISANPGSLSAGYYTASLTVNTSAGSASIPVTLLISAQATMVLGPAGAQFSVPQGGSLGNPSGSFLVSVSSTSPVSYSTSVLGASWLQGGGTGSASNSSPGTVHYSLDPVAVAALPVGAYYGTIRVTGTGILNTPQDFQVVLNVSPASTPVVPDPQPGGLLFLSAASGALPPQSVQLTASSKTPLLFSAAATTSDGAGWLSISPTSGSTAAGTPAQILVSVNSAGLTPGVYSGSVSFASGPNVRTVNVTLVVETPAGAPSLVPSVSGLRPAADSPVCANAKLVPAPTGLVSNFSAPASWPTPISLKLVDTCGTSIGKGQIVATFSNGDPPLALSPVDAANGIYSGTWTPRKSAAQTTITAQATAQGYSPATVQVLGQVVPNAAPQLTPNGTLDVFNPLVGGGLGPGNIVQIYGTALASQAIVAATLPLPTKVAGTQVLIGGITAPLFYVSPTQVNAQIPFELNAGQRYEVIVSANGALTTPQPIQLNAGVPSILQFTSGLVIAQHADGTLVSDTAPASPGEFIVLYMTGLGATDVPVPTGQPSPGDPLARVLDIPQVTLNGNQVPLLFAGLTPGLVGLYQINFQVPGGLADKTYNLEVSQSGVVSNSTSLPIKSPAGQ